MDAKLELLNFIPFRALLSIARALGGVGADPHRLPGGKTGLVNALVSRYGVDAILSQWQTEKGRETPHHGDATPAPTPDLHSDTPDGPGIPDTAHTPQGEERDGQGDGERDGQGSPDGMGPQARDGDGQGEPQGEPKGDAPAPGEGDAPAPAPESPQGPEKGQGEAPEAPDECPSPDEPAPAPEKESPMDAAIREIARQEAERAVYPVAQWANGAMLPAFVSLADAVRRNASRGSPQGEMEFHAPGPSVPLPAPGVPPRFDRKTSAIHHKLFPKLLALCAQGAQPLLVGPSGTGKSHAAKAVAEHFGYTFNATSFSAGVSESTLVGWLLPVGDSGRFDYVPSPFVTAYETGNSVSLWDEMGTASPDMLIISNSATANGGISIPQRFNKPYVKRGPNALIIGATNVLDGADDMYSASQAMDKATSNRFYALHWGHDEALERSLAGLPGTQKYWRPQGLTEWTPEQWIKASEFAYAWVGAVRATLAAHKLPHVFSVRQVVMYQQALRAGCTHKEIRADLLMAWGPDEIARLPVQHQPKNAPAVGSELDAV